MIPEEDPCKCGHDLVRHDMGHGCIECRCRGFRDERADRQNEDEEEADRG